MNSESRLSQVTYFVTISTNSFVDSRGIHNLKQYWHWQSLLFSQLLKPPTYCLNFAPHSPAVYPICELYQHSFSTFSVPISRKGAWDPAFVMSSLSITSLSSSSCYTSAKYYYRDMYRLVSWIRSHIYEFNEAETLTSDGGMPHFLPWQCDLCLLIDSFLVSTIAVAVS